MIRVARLFSQFLKTEKAGGLILVAVTLLSLCLANSAWQNTYINFWHSQLGNHSVTDWINDGLMTIFFLLIGIELEREIYSGELSQIKNAALPLFGALGGMIVPAVIYMLFNFGTETQSGAGIPMATDIAFAVGILSLLGKRVPLSLKIFLTALAVIDDLGAIIVIAIFYTKTIAFQNLAMAIGTWLALLLMNRLKVRHLFPYIIGGIVMWYFMLHSGVHPTITGVMLAFAVPFGKGNKKSTSYILQNALHFPVAFIILPLFAIANTCIPIENGWHNTLLHTSSLGIIVGLVFGKPLGIWLFSFVAASFGWCALPVGLKWKNIIGAGFLGGIGFTMSIFITLLAFGDGETIDHTKIAILAASVIAAGIGFVMLKVTLKK